MIRLSKSAFHALWDLHAWLGVGGGLLLHVICFTGAFTVFYDELVSWQDPALRVHTADVRPLAQTVEPLLASGQMSPKRIDVYLQSDSRPTVGVRYMPIGGSQREMIHLDATGTVVAERSQIARTLFYLHFLTHERWFPQGIYVAGFLGTMMMLGLLTGVVIHLRNLAGHLHRFRPHKRAVVAWTDAHKVLGVFGLPFQAVAAFTGAVICFGPLLLQLFAHPLFHGDAKAAERALYGDFSSPRSKGESAPVLALDELIERAREAVPALRPVALRIQNFGDAEGIVIVRGKLAGETFGSAMVTVRLRDGAVLRTDTPSQAGAAQLVERWIRQIHFVEFGGWAAKVIFFVAALSTCFTILSGNLIWLLRRDSTSSRVLFLLTLAAGPGLGVATGALFCANRAIPMHFGWRTTAESVAFFGVWTATFVWSFVARNRRRTTVRLLATSGAFFVLAAVLDALTSAARMWSVDLVLLVVGASAAAAAYLVHQSAWDLDHA